MDTVFEKNLLLESDVEEIEEEKVDAGEKVMNRGMIDKEKETNLEFRENNLAVDGIETEFLRNAIR